jgi:hypothetical protein
VLQFLIEEALLEHLELDDALHKAREAEQHRSDEAVGQSHARLERVLEAQAAVG